MAALNCAIVYNVKIRLSLWADLERTMDTDEAAAATRNALFSTLICILSHPNLLRWQLRQALPKERQCC